MAMGKASTMRVCLAYLTSYLFDSTLSIVAVITPLASIWLALVFPFVLMPYQNLTP